MSALAAGTAPSPTRPATGRLVGGQLGYCLRQMWRSKVVFVFTFLFPLTWLMVIGLLAGNDAVDPASGVRVMQFVTPTAAAMGVLYATLPTVSTDLASAREEGRLKRVRGTPLPSWMHLAGHIGAAVTFALAAVVTMLVVGVAVYDVRIVWATAVATAVTVVLGIACFAAMGLAVAMLAPSAGAAQGASVAAAVVLGFISDMFFVGGQMPLWISRIASLFPLKHFIAALKDQFNPFLGGSGWNLTAIAVMLAWTLASVLVAVRAFGWDPRERGGRGGASPGAAPEAASGAGISGGRGDPAASHPRRTTAVAASSEQVRATPLGVLWRQFRWTNAAAWRDPGSLFFAVAMPVGLYAFTMAIYGGAPNMGGVSFALYFAAGMMAWGAAVTAFVNMPEAVLKARDQGVLKRLRGTPLQPAVYLGARALSLLWIAGVTAAMVMAVGLAFFDLDVSWWGVPLAAGVLLLGVLTLGACGLALASLLPDSRASTAVGLGILLPLAFFSDVFPVGESPAWMSAVGSAMPLKHVANGLSAALDPAGPTVSWGGLAVMTAWLVLTAYVAVRRFRWQPRS